MDWDTLRTSLDWALNSSQGAVKFVFLGGEPLLEFSLIRKAVEHVEGKRPPNRHVQYALSTNGTLVGEEVAHFFGEHRFEVQLSFDGIPGAQDLRAKDTFGVLDGLLDNLRQRHTRLFCERLTVSVTVIPPAIPHLADSIEYFMAKGCRRIAVAPLITSHPAWSDRCLDELESQFARLSQVALRCYRQTGRVPLLVFGKERSDAECRQRCSSMCAVLRGETPAVDVDGQIYGCALLAESYQKFASPLLCRLHEVMKIGRLDDSDLGARFSRFLKAAWHNEVLNHKERKYSSYARCDDCPHFSDCHVCPVSIGHIADNTDPNRIPDFACAFNRIALKYRDRFFREAHGEGDEDLGTVISRFRALVDDSREGVSF